MPAVDPVTRPPTTVMLPVPLVLLHVPPAIASLSNVVKPWHTLNVPSIGPGVAVTVTITVVKHPAENA